MIVESVNAFKVHASSTFCGVTQVRMSHLGGMREGTSRVMDLYKTMRAYSAGGVVFRLAPICSPDRDFLPGQNEIDVEHHNFDKMISIEVVLVGRSYAGIWALPKGTPEPGETIEQVALREAQEETGLQVQLIAYIGSISYAFVHEQVRYRKQVRHFLLEAVGGDTSLHDHEYDLVQWFPYHEACRLLTYQNEVNILYQAEEMLQYWLQYRQQEGQK
jgi:8-oxo-dGTP pyrophosphatase MutT (NUDIX family)